MTNNMNNANNTNNTNNHQAPSATPPWGVPLTAVPLGVNSWGTSSLWVFRTDNRVRVQYGFQSAYETTPNNKGNTSVVVSEPVYKKLTQLKAKNGFDFLLDMPGSFERPEVDEARNKFKESIEKMKFIDASERSPIHDVYLLLCDYVKKNIKEDIIAVTQDVNCQFANIETSAFKDWVSMENLGWKPMEIKKRFKQLQLLRINHGRAYDWAMTNKNGQTYRTISVKMEVEHHD